MQIVSGRVVFARSVQPAQYETKKAEVEIAFILAEGEQLGDSLDIAGLLAKVKVLEMVGLKSATAEAASTAGLKAVASAVEEPKDPTKPPKVKPQKEAAAAAMNAKDTSTRATTAGPAEKPSKPAETASSTASDPDDALFADAPAAADPISDQDLTKAASDACKRLIPAHDGAAGAMVKALRDKFITPPGTRVSDIPQGKRAEFLKQLEALE